jgi:hypothetical protein
MGRRGSNDYITEDELNEILANSRLAHLVADPVTVAVEVVSRSQSDRASSQKEKKSHSSEVKSQKLEVVRNGQGIINSRLTLHPSPSPSPQAKDLDDFVPLSPQEEQLRSELESQVEQAFYVAGTALRQLRDQRLYRASHRNFEDYCRSRFKFQRRHAYQLMEAAAVVDNLCANGTQILPTHERQVRPLVSLKSEEQGEAWEQAVEEAGGQVPSGRLVKQIVRELHPPTKLPQFQINEVCQILVKENPELTGLHKCWGMVFRVAETSCWVACWNGQYQVPTEHLESLDYSLDECQLVGQLERRLRRFQETVGVMEEAALGILEKLGKLDRPHLTALEEVLLGVLEREYEVGA